MKVEQVLDGSWLATGKGPIRPIVAEGGTRQEATHGFSSQFREQDMQIEPRDYEVPAWLTERFKGYWP